MPWKQLSSEEKYRSPWMHVTEDKLETDSGKMLTWSVVHQNPCAMVIPWDGERFGLVGLYRYPIDRFSWEFPSGSVSGVSMDEAAKRELKEEAGLTAGSYERLGSFYLANGSATQSMDVYLATDLTDGEAEPDAGEEGIQFKRVTYSELCAMIDDGTIKDGPTIAAITYLHTSGWVKQQGL
ncbi:MAG: NUDIX hydrolase [Patescibacteria group bacterium]